MQWVVWKFLGTLIEIRESFTVPGIGSAYMKELESV